MSLNPNISLQVQGIDTATPLRQLGQDLQRNEMLSQKIIGQRYQNLDAREKGRIGSVSMMAAELSPLLESGDTSAALQKLKTRRTNLQKQVAEGLPVDTSETDRLIGILESGDLEQAKNVMAGQVQLGQMLGILESPDAKATANMRDYKHAQENPGFQGFLNKQGARQLSGTEAIVSNLRKEDPSLTYAQGLALAQGLARKGITFDENNNAVVMPGVDNSLEDLERSKKDGSNKSDLEFKPRIAGDEVKEKKKEERLSDLRIKLPKAQSTLITIKEKTSRVAGDIDEVISDLKAMNVPPGRVIAQYLPLTKSNAIAKKLQSIQANFFVDELTEMRANSPTGGAVGQASDAEGERLSNARAALNLNIQLPDLLENLEQAKAATLGASSRMQNAFDRDFSDLGENASQLFEQPQNGSTSAERLRFNHETGDFE